VSHRLQPSYIQVTFESRPFTPRLHLGCTNVTPKLHPGHNRVPPWLQPVTPGLDPSSTRLYTRVTPWSHPGHPSTPPTHPTKIRATPNLHPGYTWLAPGLHQGYNRVAPEPRQCYNRVAPKSTKVTPGVRPCDTRVMPGRPCDTQCYAQVTPSVLAGYPTSHLWAWLMVTSVPIMSTQVRERGGGWR
jgi:hypothetical protein